MSPILLPEDMHREIASHVDTKTLVQMLSLSSTFRLALRHFLYRHIDVAHTCDKLVVTLAEDAELANLVHSLILVPFKQSGIPDTVWAKAFKQTVNLTHLSVSQNVYRPLSPFTFQITSFTGHGSLKLSWIQFINSNPNLKELRLYGDQVDVKKIMLPALERLAADANVIANLSLFRPIEELVLFPDSSTANTIREEDLVMLGRVKPGVRRLRIKFCLLANLVELAPKFLRYLQDLVLDDGFRHGGTICDSEDVLTPEHFPHLRSVHIVSRLPWPSEEDLLWAANRLPILPRLTHCWPTAFELSDRRKKSRTAEKSREEEWRLSMQGVADMAEEWAADSEDQWQEWAEKLADCARELHGLQSTPQPGSTEYWRWCVARRTGNK
ncbi:hypothetical protein C8J57DRAFT_1632041 [Mycena rebaudengoi]|nr:hypothetical protein C8J57DRAFT_1632041 [Mycena rebaudengoi]